MQNALKGFQGHSIRVIVGEDREGQRFGLEVTGEFIRALGEQSVKFEPTPLTRPSTGFTVQDGKSKAFSDAVFRAVSCFSPEPIERLPGGEGELIIVWPELSRRRVK